MVVLRLAFNCLLLSLAIVRQSQAGALNERCLRLVSLSPSVTEAVYFMGLGPNLVAVSQYDSFPPEVVSKPRVGALFGTNLEAVLTYRPSTVIVLDEQSDTKNQLEQIKVPTLTVDHRSVLGILKSLEQIADYCSLIDERIRIDQLQSDYNLWQQRTANLKRPAVLTLLATAESEGVKQSAYVLGRDGFYQDLVYAAGGRSAYEGMTRLMPDVSIEGILALKPDVILLLTNSRTTGDKSFAEQIKRLLPKVPAVKNSRIYTLNDDGLLIPGPRFIEILSKFYRLLHPEDT